MWLRRGIAVLLLAAQPACVPRSVLPAVTRKPVRLPPPEMLVITKGDARTYAAGTVVEWNVPDGYPICFQYEREPLLVACAPAYTLRIYVLGTDRRAEP